MLMLVVGFSYGISCYELLYSPRGVSYGASYTDVMVQLPAYGVLSLVALGIENLCLLPIANCNRFAFIIGFPMPISIAIF